MQGNGVASDLRTSCFPIIKPPPLLTATFDLQLPGSIRAGTHVSGIVNVNNQRATPQPLAMVTGRSLCYCFTGSDYVLLVVRHGRDA